MADETPEQRHIDWLRQNPEAHSPGFDVRFGAGAAASALAQGTPEAPAAVIPEAPPAPEDQSWLEWAGEGAVDMGRGAVEGVINAGAETLDFIQEGLNPTMRDAEGSAVELNMDVGAEGQVAATTTPTEEAPAYSDLVGQGVEAVTGLSPEEIIPVPVTALGEVTSSVTQFLAGMVGAGKLTGLRGLKGAFVNGAIADAVVFDPEDGNLSRLMADNEMAIPLLTEALATDPDDPEWVNRMRNAAEGVVAGAMVETVLRGFRAVAKTRKAAQSGDEAAVKEAEELTAQAADEAQDILDNGLVFQSRRPEAVAARQAAADAPPAQAAAEAPPPPRVEEATRAPLIDREALEAVLSRTERIIPADLDNALSFNFDKMDGPYEAQAVIQAVTDVMQETGVSARLGLDQPETFEATIKGAKEELAGMLGLGIEDFTRRVGRLAEAGQNQASLLVAGKTALQSTGREIVRLSEEVERMISADVMDNVAVDKLFDLMDTHVNLQNYLKAAQTQAARLVSAGRIATEDGLDEAAVANLRRVAADQRVAARGGQERVSKLVRGIRAAKTPAQRAAVIRSYSKPRAWDVVNEVFINNILSGYKTHLVNITSNSINVAYLPFERTVGGLIDGVVNGREGFAEAAKGMYQYSALRESIFNGIRLAGRVMKTENPVLDAAVKLDAQEGYGRAIRAETFGLDGAALGGRLVNGLGVIQRIPGRLLMAEDEFFKQTMFRSRLKASLTVDASRMTPAELNAAGYTSRGEYVEGEMGKSIISIQNLEDQWQLLLKQGKVTDNPTTKKAFFDQNLGNVNELSAPARDALRAAREATFTTPVLKGTITESYMKMANRHPWLRGITPFIQTPANILSKAWDRLPGLNLIRERYRARLKSPDPAIRAEAAGEMATGVALSTGLYMLALEGRITGGGPQDPRQRELWLNDKNWQPYSINFGTVEDPHWVAINRFDPWATAMGIAGDLSEIVQAAENDPGLGSQSLFAMLGTAAATNITNKTYMAGISDLFEAMAGGQGGANAMSSWAKNYGSAFVPFSSAGRQINQLSSPYLQEARAFGDRIKQNIPGMSGDLPVRYNWVTGQPMDRPENVLGFIQVARGSDDAVQTELRQLNYGFTGPDRRIGMIQLSSQQYQNWARLMGTVKLSGRTLHQTLERTIRHPRYDLERERVPDGIVAPEESHRVRMVAAVISAYKEAARAELMMENPDLADAWEASMLYRGEALRGTAQPGARDNLLLDFR
jgi:hypothetical protein